MDDERVLTRRALDEGQPQSGGQSGAQPGGRQTQRAPRPTTLSRNITQYRLAAGLTQEQVGACLNPPVDRNSVSRWENGRHIPDHQNLVALALLFGVKLHQLFDPDSFPDDDEDEEQLVEATA